MAVNLSEFRRRIGKVKYEKIVRYANALRKRGESPNEIAERVMAKYPGAIRATVNLIFTIEP